jgi:hypothetical protein
MEQCVMGCTGRIVNSGFEIQDPPRRAIEFKGGHMEGGDVYLNTVFAALRETLKTNDVLIFWSYRVRPINGPPSKRFSGYLTIPKVTGDASK